MIELAIAALLGAVLPSAAAFIIRYRSHTLLDQFKQDRTDYKQVMNNRMEEQAHKAEASVRQLRAEHNTTVRVLEKTLDDVSSKARDVLSDTNDKARAVLSDTEATNAAGVDMLNSEKNRLNEDKRQLRDEITGLQGEIEGLNSAHAKTEEWADKILRHHDWHVGGKGNPHDRGVLVLFECECGSKTYAEPGTL